MPHERCGAGSTWCSRRSPGLLSSRSRRRSRRGRCTRSRGARLRARGRRLLYDRRGSGALRPSGRCRRRCGLRLRRRNRRRPGSIRRGRSSRCRPFTRNRPSSRALAWCQLLSSRLHGRRGRWRGWRPRRLRRRRGRMRYLGLPAWGWWCGRCWALRRGCAWRWRLWLLRGPRRRSSGRHGMLRRCSVGWRSGRRLWRWALRRSPRRLLFVFLVMTGFALRLRDLNGSCLRVRCRACELHRRQGCCGKQHETKFCHDGPNPPEGS